jgi:iron complex transport system substrate-binding protein
VLEENFMSARRLRRRATVVVLALVLAAIGAPFAAVTGAEMRGRIVVPVQPRVARIISLVPAVTEMLFAMDAGPQVIAVSSYDRFPPEVASRPKVGALVDPDFERIIALRPELVVVYGSQQDLIDRLARVKIPIFNYRHAALPDISETIQRLGDRIGRSAEAKREVARIQRELDDVRRAVAGRPRPKTALLFGREEGTLRSVFASAGVGFMHDMLDIAGGADAFGDVKRQSLQVTTETMIARAPEVILELHPGEGWTPERIERERALWKALPTLPAVRAGHVYMLADDLLLVPGPRVDTAVRMIARALHPEAFPR